jgi:decaprenylphospho-beta-D-erythro-pentofuranosid-2-ulose 2-reductase
MLKNKSKFSEIALVGSTSDIGISIINNLTLGDNAKLHLIGRQIPENHIFRNKQIKFIFHKCDLSNSLEVKEFLSDLSKFNGLNLVLIAAGFLPEEDSEFNLNDIQKTFQINSLSSIMFLSSFTRLMNSNRGGNILVCSSVASIRPRIRNFTYGASKSALDFYAVGLQNKQRKSNVSISILRPGFVFTKMTSNFKPAPFAINLNSLGKIASKGLMKGKKVIYAPSKLKVVMNILRFMPRFFFNRL